MYKASLFILLACILVFQCRTPVSFSIKNCSITYNKQWTKVSIAGAGGSPPYQYFIDQYPKNWRYIKQDIYIPKQSLQQNRKYPCKIRILDQNRNQARASIVFTVLNGKVSISESINPYDKIYDQRFFNSDNCRGRPDLTKSGSYYNYGNDIDLTDYDDYVPYQELKNQKQKVQQLNSQSISKQYGVGLNKAFTQSQINKAYTSKGTFSLVNLFAQMKKVDNANINSNSDSQKDKNNVLPTSTTQYFPAVSSSPIIPKTNKPKKSQTNSKNPDGNSSYDFSNFFNQIVTSTQKSFQQSDYITFQRFANGSQRISPTTAPKAGSSSGLITVDRTSNSIDINFIKNPSQMTYQQLPNSQQIDDMILGADGIVFTKLVQNINRTSVLNCEQKVQYLNSLLGRIKSAISMKTFANEQLQSLINTANASYNSIIKQISNKNQQIKNLNLITLRQKVQADLATLQNLYAQYNKVDGSTASYESNNIILKNDIASIRAKSDIDRKQLVRQKLAYNQADIVVKSLQQKIKDANARKKLIQNGKYNLSVVVSNFEAEIKIGEANITILQQQIAKLENQSDSIKITSNNLEITVDRYRQNIAKISTNQQYFLNDISTLEQKVKIEQKKIVTDQLNKLKQMVATLAKSIPTIQSYLDNNYYKCYNVSSLITNRTGDSTIFVISIADFQKYIQDSYSLKIDWKKINLISSNIQLTSINILDSSWQSAFGLPYSTISFASTQDFSFSDDFNCLSPSNLMSGFGKISKISDKYISIKNLQGQIINLAISTCTRLETTQFLPSIGQTIFWRGNPGIKTGQFNIYRASCI